VLGGAQRVDARRALGLDAPFGRPGPRLADTSSPLRTPKDSGYYPWTPGDGYPLCTVADRWGVLEVGGTRVTPTPIRHPGTVKSEGPGGGDWGGCLQQVVSRSNEHAPPTEHASARSNVRPPPTRPCTRVRK
jgi:hypothetical protein